MNEETNERRSRLGLITIRFIPKLFINNLFSYLEGGRVGSLMNRGKGKNLVETNLSNTGSNCIISEKSLIHISVST